jgi:hypothetical protein
MLDLAGRLIIFCACLGWLSVMYAKVGDSWPRVAAGWNDNSRRSIYLILDRRVRPLKNGYLVFVLHKPYHNSFRPWRSIVGDYLQRALCARYSLACGHHFSLFSFFGRFTGLKHLDLGCALPLCSLIAPLIHHKSAKPTPKYL